MNIDRRITKVERVMSSQPNQDVDPVSVLGFVTHFIFLSYILSKVLFMYT